MSVLVQTILHDIYAWFPGASVAQIITALNQTLYQFNVNVPEYSDSSSLVQNAIFMNAPQNIKGITSVSVNGVELIRKELYDWIPSYSFICRGDTVFKIDTVDEGLKFSYVSGSPIVSTLLEIDKHLLIFGTTEYQEENCGYNKIVLFSDNAITVDNDTGLSVVATTSGKYNGIVIGESGTPNGYIVRSDGVILFDTIIESANVVVVGSNLSSSIRDYSSIPTTTIELGQLDYNAVIMRLKATLALMLSDSRYTIFTQEAIVAERNSKCSAFSSIAIKPVLW